jgi:hypothetical protein
MKSMFALSFVFKSLLATFFVFGGSSAKGLEGNETGSLVDQIRVWRSANDVSAIIRILPDIEKLWPPEPDNYFRCMTEVMPCLAYASPTNKQAAESILFVFTNLMRTNYQGNLAVATRCLDLQRAAIESSFNWEVMQHDKSCLVQYAKFLGEIRSLKIENYTMRGSSMPTAAKEIFMRAHVPPIYSLLTNAEDKKAFDQAMADAGQGRLMDDFQHTLLEADNGTKFLLLAFCSYFPSSSPTNVDFIREIAVDAHLTEPEYQKLGIKK